MTDGRALPAGDFPVRFRVFRAGALPAGGSMGGSPS